MPGIALLGGSVALALFAASDKAIVVAVIFSAFSLVVLVNIILDSARAVHSLYGAFLAVETIARNAASEPDELIVVAPSEVASAKSKSAGEVTLAREEF